MCVNIDCAHVPSTTVQKELRYWVLSDGRCVAWSVTELAEKHDDELVDPNAREAYYAIGKELDHEPLGMLPDSELGP